MKKSLVIFDLDGTLIDSVPDLADGVDGMLAHFGKSSAGMERVRTWVGNGSLKLVERALVWADLPLDNLPYAHEIFLQKYADSQGKTAEYQGVSIGLNQLIQNGFTLALCTNKPARFLPDILKNMGWADIFACVVGGDSLAVKKPNPEPLLHICKTLGMDKNQAVMVGDSKNDIIAGQKAGMMTLALTYGYNYGEPITNSQPEKVFGTFGELVDFIIKQS